MHLSAKPTIGHRGRLALLVGRSQHLDLLFRFCYSPEFQRMTMVGRGLSSLPAVGQMQSDFLKDCPSRQAGTEGDPAFPLIQTEELQCLFQSLNEGGFHCCDAMAN
mmetsp:Transcript_33094/g.59407  ORF Transcript_33094/g.59407 Transcript_33094/m.59407 type:complete len:106 (-) Transcript_33094:857-1174(-)